MRAVSFLAAFAQVQDQQLHVIGGGFDAVAAGMPFSLAAIVYIDWDETNLRHEVKYELVDANGTPTGPLQGGPPVMAEIPMEIGRPPGIPRGVTFHVCHALNFAGLLLAPGRYEFRVTINGVGHPDWNAPFEVRANGNVPGVASI